jgi:hypothetical protein
MHAVTLALPLLAALSATPEPVEEVAAEAAPAVEMELPAYFHMRVESGKALVTVPILDGEADAWASAMNGEKTFPSRLDALRPTKLVAAGATVDPGTFFGYRTEGGASEMWWVIAFDAEGMRDGHGLAILGDVDAPELRKPGLVPLASAEGQEHLVTIRNVLDTKLSSADRKRLGKKVLSKNRVQIVDGSFPDGGTMLVVINVPMKGELVMSISSMFTLTSEGEIATMLHAPKMRHDHFELHALGDVDADGFDDLTFMSAYYEGQYEHLLRWNDGKPSVARIAGDGA